MKKIKKTLLHLVNYTHLGFLGTDKDVIFCHSQNSTT